MNENNPSEEQRFKENVLGLTDLVHFLITDCWNNGVKEMNPTMIHLASMYLSGFDNVQLIETFIRHSHMYWDEIKSQNENFFIEHSSSIFSQLPVGKGNIDAFKTLFTAKKNGVSIISPDDKAGLWEYFTSLVKICIKYVHRVRDCYLEENKSTGRMQPRYRYEKFPEIKVRECAKKWDVKIEIPSI